MCGTASPTPDRHGVTPWEVVLGRSGSERSLGAARRSVVGRPEGLAVLLAAHAGDRTPAAALSRRAIAWRRAARPLVVVCDRAARPAVAADTRPVRDPRQRGHAAADAGGARGAPLRGLAAALARRGSACGRPAGRGPAGVGRARLQSPRAATARGLSRGHPRRVAP